MCFFVYATYLRHSYEALGLLPTLNPNASGGVESQAVPHSDEHSMERRTAPEAPATQKEAASIIPKGYGRIVRDANGNIIDVEMGEEEEDAAREGKAGQAFPEDVDVSTQEGVTPWVKLGSHSERGAAGVVDNHVVHGESFRRCVRNTRTF